MPEGLAAMFWGVVTFSLLVVIHEGGHFMMARLFGVKVHEFMVGLPGPALRFHGPKTTYGITAIPLGGYVRIAGMEPGPEDPDLAAVLAETTRLGTADASDIALSLGIEDSLADRLLMTLADWDALEAVEGESYRYRSKFSADEALDPDSLLDKARSVTYRSLSTWKRVVVLSAGVVFNLLTAVLVFTIVLSAFGIPQFDPATTTIGEVSAGSGADAAGIEPGDRVVSIDGRTIGEWADIPAAIGERQPGEVIDVVVQREGQQVALQAELGENPRTGGAALGVGAMQQHVRLSLPAALAESISYIGMTFVAITALFNPATFSQSVEGATSIIGISYIAAEVVQTSAIQYASLVALISLSLGVVNILPIPPLDGGKIAVELIERFAGRRIPRKFSLGMSAVGAVLLFSLIFYLMYADIMRFIVN